MSDQDDDALWAEVGAALTPRRSEAQWTAFRARVMSRVKGAAQARLRPWVAASALAALGFGLVLISRLTQEPVAVETAAVAWDTRIAATEGLVTVIPSGRTDEVPAAEGLPVQAGDLIRVGPDGRAELAVADKGVVSVGPNSVLKLARLDRAQSFLELSVGSLVAKLDWHGDGEVHRLAVRTPAAVAAVRGTEFGVVVGDDGATSVGVFDQGRVSVTDNDAPSVQETMLTPHQELHVSRGAAPDTELRDGRYYLRPGALDELQSYRPVLDQVRDREQAVRRDWRPMSAEEREQARARRFDGAANSGAPQAGPSREPQNESRPGVGPRGASDGSDERGSRADGPRGRQDREPENGDERRTPDAESRGTRGGERGGPPRGPGPRGPGDGPRGRGDGPRQQGNERPQSGQGPRPRRDENSSHDSGGGPPRR